MTLQHGSEGADLLARADEHIAQGRAQAALPLLERALALQPRHAGCWYKLGVARLELGMLEPAEECYRMALSLEPGHAKANINLGVILQQRGALDEAERCYRAALELDARQSQAWFNLGIVFLDRGRAADALEYLLKAVQLDEGKAQWHSALASAHTKVGRPLDALASVQNALRVGPALAIAHDQLALCLLETGDARGAVAAARRAEELDPDLHTAGSNLLFALNFIPGLKPKEIYREHLSWARKHTAGSVVQQPGRGGVDKKLRIAYLSPDLRRHSVAFFMEPVLRWHDRSCFEVVCYSDADVEDDVSRHLRALPVTWHATAKLTNEVLAQRIREDSIDILVDLAGHTAGGKRMRLFAAKPAPMQASWLGYLNTTGLEAMDYRITDWHACPEGMERFHTERLMRMPHSQWCFDQFIEAPPVGPLPSAQSGAVTFGSFHNLIKLTPPLLELWARLLRRMAASRLLIVARGAEQLAERIAAVFLAHGVEPQRIEFIGHVPLQTYLSLHNRVDINLDAFPYSGGTTTFHSLWMGVPVVTLKGETVVSRGGVSVMTVLGLEELIADAENQYVEICASLAANPQRLGALRAELRQRLAGSPLSDGVRFTRDLEAAYRDMWRNRCAPNPGEAARV